MPKSIDQCTLMSIVASIRRNPLDSFQTIDIARRHNVTSSALIKKFKQVTGLSPLKFRAALRIELAKTLLIKSSASITSIAFDAGYNSLGTFVRTFTDMVGLAPTVFREAAQKFCVDDIVRLALNEARETRRLSADCTLVMGTVPWGCAVSKTVIMIGLFPKGVPAGRPIDGCMLFNGGRFELVWPGRFANVNLLAVAVPLTNDTLGLWLPSSVDVFVGGRQLNRSDYPSGTSVNIELNFRNLAVNDPPIVVPIPVLLGFRGRNAIREKSSIAPRV